MNILNLEHVSKRFVSRPILTDVTIGIEDRDRIGVVGINGTGKSTFLSIVAGTEEPDEGQVITRSGLRISCLPQEPVFDEGKSLLDNIADRTGDREEYWDTEGRVRNMLLRLGIDDPACSPRHLSGGQKKRAALAAALLTPCDLLRRKPCCWSPMTAIFWTRSPMRPLNWTGAALSAMKAVIPNIWT